MSNAPSGIALAESMVSVVETIKPKKDVYQVSPILPGGDYIAIAPISVKKESSIVVPDEQPTVGIIVGVGPTTPEDWRVAFKVGSTVKFSGQPICNLDGLFPYYGQARIILVRYTSVLVAVPGYSVLVTGVDEAKPGTDMSIDA
jgi:hypothetical protein